MSSVYEMYYVLSSLRVCNLMIWQSWSYHGDVSLAYRLTSTAGANVSSNVADCAVVAREQVVDVGRWIDRQLGLVYLTDEVVETERGPA